MLFLRTRFVAALVLALGVLSVAPAEAASGPPAPTGLKISTTADTATITWNASPGADYYALCLVPQYGSTRCAHASPRVTDTTYTFTDLEPTSGTDYYVRIRATNTTGGTNTDRIGFNLAADPRPAAATGLAHSVIGYSSVAVSWSAVPKATSYSVCLLEVRASSSCAHTATTTSTSARIDDIAPTSGRDYYYRVEATAGGYTSRSALGEFDLPVGIAPSLKAQPVETGLTKAWWATARNAGTYEVQFALNSSMSSGLRTVTADEPRIETSELTPGRAYWFRVRGFNDSDAGGWSALGEVRPDADGAEVTVLTWNLCGQDKCVTSSNKMSRWTSTRKDLAGSYARSAGAGIIATQESHSKDTQFGTELPGYNVAAYYSAKTLFYDTSKYSRERAGVITLDSARGKYAVWGQFRSLETGTRFFVADAHLEPYKGKTYDDRRAAQTRVLIKEIAEANDEGLPVVYAGDYNSNESNANQSKYAGGYDAPLRIFTDAGIPDSIDIAETSYYTDWNSANQAKNPPLRYSDHVDHVFVDPSITVLEWRVMLRASSAGYSVPFASDHNPLRVKLQIPGSS